MSDVLTTSWLVFIDTLNDNTYSDEIVIFRKKVFQYISLPAINSNTRSKFTVLLFHVIFFLIY